MRVMYIDDNEGALSADIVTEIFVRKNLYDELDTDIQDCFEDDVEVAGLVIYTQEENVIIVPCSIDVANQYVNTCFETDKLNLVHEDVVINCDEEDWQMILDSWKKK